MTDDESIVYAGRRIDSVSDAFYIA